MINERLQPQNLKKKMDIEKIEKDNKQFARKLAYVKSSIPSNVQLEKEFKDHLKKKVLRSRLPVKATNKRTQYSSL